MDPHRHVKLERSFNFRDLGGYVTHDGRRVRWRQLFRADGLGRLTERDMAVIDELGVATVIDLRSSWELEVRGAFPSERVPGGYYHIPVLEEVRDRRRFPEDAPVGFMAEMYLEMLAQGSQAIRQAFSILARAGSLPAVFHCSAGKDRTGILAALVLSLLGVPEEQVVEDYALSQPAMDAMRAALARESPETSRALAELPASIFSAEPEGMEKFLTTIVEEHGSVEALITSLGVSGAEVAALRESLLS